MTIDEIYQELSGEFQQRTGLSVSGNSELSVRFYAVAAQLFGLYRQVEWTQQQCFPQTATGGSLDLHAATRSISRKKAVKASGTVRFFAGEDRSADAVIPVGTVCMTAEGLRYMTTQAGVIPMGETQIDLPVEAAEPGAAHNVAAGRIIYLALPPSGVTACTNPEPMTGGQDEEDDESLRQRVLDTYSRLSNGANAAFYQQAAMSFDGIAAATVLPRNRGAGTVDVVVTSHSGIPDDELLEEIRAYFEQIREIAVDVSVSAPTEAAVNISAVLTAKNGYTFEEISQSVRNAVESRFTGRLLGCPVLQAELTALIFGVEGVANCAVTVEGGDLTVDSVTLPCLGTLDITEG